QLVVRIDLIILRVSVERPLCGIDARTDKRGSQILKADPIGRQRRRINLDPNSGLLATADSY
ncbi:MAG: hypothetical protein JWR02_3140, partial [Mucilaginibacter sp.]|nr:hypothetical protein [Mucilaginibacter sp.]